MANILQKQELRNTHIRAAYDNNSRLSSSIFGEGIARMWDFSAFCMRCKISSICKVDPCEHRANKRIFDRESHWLTFSGANAISGCH